MSGRPIRRFHFRNGYAMRIYLARLDRICATSPFNRVVLRDGRIRVGWKSKSKSIDARKNRILSRLAGSQWTRHE